MVYVINPFKPFVVGQCLHHIPGDCECDLIRTKVLADGIDLRILRRDSPGLSGWTLNAITSILIKEERAMWQQRQRFK